jgi:hypothetical protein
MLNGYTTTDLQVHNPWLAEELKAAARHHAWTVDTDSPQKQLCCNDSSDADSLSVPGACSLHSSDA